MMRWYARRNVRARWSVLVLCVGSVSCGSAAPLHTETVQVGKAPSSSQDDRDGDGIADSVDKCPDEPEDFDGFEDTDGCPEPDNDHDGIADADDKCPNDPEDKDGFEDDDGCPDPDNDKDGILDKDDKCPNEPETYNGFQDDDGCPDNSKVVVNGGNPKPADDVIEFAPGSAALTATANATLDRIASIMKAYKQLELVQIEGHAALTEPKALALSLSQQRANAMRNALIAKGVEAKRLRAKGFGAWCPRHPNESPRNARAELRLAKNDGISLANKLGCDAATNAGIVSDPVP